MTEPAPPPASPFHADVLAGQVAFVTGGGTGIGKQIARLLGQHGARIAIASRKLDVLEATKAELEAEGLEVHIDTCDVRDPAAVQGVVDGILARFGRLDIVVNNAAGNFPAPITGISFNGFKSVVDIDLLGTYNVSKIAFESYLGDHGGSIVNISAPFEGMGAAMQAHVAAAKSGVNSLTRTCAVEWGSHGVRVNAIGPGSIGGTEGVRRFADAVSGSSARTPNTPVGIQGHGFDIGFLLLFLCTPAARLINGQCLNVDGGSSVDQLKLGRT